MIKHRRRKRNPKLFFLSLAIGAGVFFLAIAAWLAFLLVEIPSIENLKERKIAESTKIYDYTGETLLWEVHGDERRTVVPLDRISRHIQNATIAIEDSSFYTHGGVRIPSIIRAAIADIFQGKKQEKQGFLSSIPLIISAFPRAAPIRQPVILYVLERL